MPFIRWTLVGSSIIWYVLSGTGYAQPGYILTNYEIARIVWEYGPIGLNNAPERGIVRCTVGTETFEAAVVYPTAEIRVTDVVPQPRSAEYVCVIFAENRAGRSEPSPAVAFIVLRAPSPPSQPRLLP